MKLRVIVVSVLLALGAAGCGGKDDGGSSRRTELVGLVKLTAGAAKGSTLTGTWFRMVQIGGTASKGPYMRNANSRADGGQATLLDVDAHLQALGRLLPGHVGQRPLRLAHLAARVAALEHRPGQLQPDVPVGHR